MPDKRLFMSFMLLLALLNWGGCKKQPSLNKSDFSSEITQLNEAGVISAANTVLVNAPNWGGNLRITWMETEGKVVAAGDTLILFETTSFGTYIQQKTDELVVTSLKVASSRASEAANLTRSQNSISKARLAFEMAGLDVENKRYESDFVRSGAELAGRQAEIDLKQALRNSVAQATLDSLEIAQALLKSQKQEARVEQLQTYLDQLTVISSSPGMVVHHRQYTDEGIKSFRAGDEVPRQAPVLEVTDTSAMKVQFTIHEKDRWRLKTGQKVEIVLDAYTNVIFKGSVEKVGRLALEASEGGVARRFEAIATIDGIDPRLMPGMSARVTIDLGGSSEK